MTSAQVFVILANIWMASYLRDEKAVSLTVAVMFFVIAIIASWISS